MVKGAEDFQQLLHRRLPGHDARADLGVMEKQHFHVGHVSYDQLMKLSAESMERWVPASPRPGAATAAQGLAGCGRPPWELHGLPGAALPC